MQLSMELRAKEFLLRWEEEVLTCLQMEKYPMLNYGETWVLDERFTKPHNEEESFASKTDKYQPMYKNRVIPVVIG